MERPLPVFTVSTLTEAIRQRLTTAFPTVRVEGEIGSVVFHATGHWYLVLKDAGATLNAAMFRTANRFMSWRPVVGDRVVAVGSVDVYPPRGSYNLVIQQMTRAGAGNLLARLEALKARLAAEGLFAVERKRPIPSFPRAVGVVTSTDGAALKDILKVHGERFAGLPVYVAGCRVQGEGAAPEIAAALDRLVRHGKSDVIVLARGGGSAEDLWAFNEECVVRAVVASPRPVVTGVGHEVDTTLADLAADLRAATPTHAAQMVIPDRRLLLARIADVRRALADASLRQVRHRRERLAAWQARLRDPRRRINDARIRCDELADRLTLGIRRLLASRQAVVERLAGRLDALSPYATLDRGYALVRREGHVVTRADTLAPGDVVRIRFASGQADARIVSIESDSQVSLSSLGTTWGPSSSGTVESR